MCVKTMMNLSELLSNEGISKTYPAQITMTVFNSGFGGYHILSSTPLEITVTNLGDRKLRIETSGTVTLDIPCDRCLESVPTDIDFTIDRTIAMDSSKADGIESEEQDFMEGHCLDVDKLVFPEILINLPDKTLCREDCKGLCPVCGNNLNLKECGCDRVSLDPRMSVIQDIFNNCKEV